LSRRRAATALAFFLSATVTMTAGAATVEEQYLLAVKTLDGEGFQGIDGALESFEAVILRDGSFLPAYLSAAEACLLKYEFSEPRDSLWLERALAHVESALARDDGLPEAYFKRAVVRFNQEEDEAAVADLARALEIEPTFLDARLLTLQHLLTAGEKKKAREFADASREHYPGDPGPLKYLADIFFQEGSLDDAIDYYRDVIALVERAPYSYLALGRAYQQQEKCDLAVEAYRRAIELEPALEELHVNLSYCYGRLDRLDLAVEHLDIYLKARPRDLSALNNAALLYEQVGNVRQAKITWLKLKEAAVGDEVDYRRRAEEHLQRLLAAQDEEEGE
jgi:tetratricopeptide (TPR) repeat protein